MNRDENRDMFTLLEYTKLNAYLDSVVCCLLDACGATGDEDLEMDLKILERIDEYIENLQIKIDEKSIALLEKNKMDAEGME